MKASEMKEGIWYNLSEIKIKIGDHIKYIGFNRDWIHPDFNPEGTRECFLYGDETEWLSAKWIDYHDSWIQDDSSKPEYIMILPTTKYLIKNNELQSI